MGFLANIFKRPVQTDNSPQTQDGPQPTEEEARALLDELIKIGGTDDE